MRDFFITTHKTYFLLGDIKKSKLLFINKKGNKGSFDKGPKKLVFNAI